MKRISVIIPVYNNEKYLHTCIESILTQTYANLEIILVNDGSTDHSWEICEAYAKKDPRIIFLSQENGGVSVARNAGLEAAHGDYISFVDSDDYLEPDAYETVLGIFEKEAPNIVCFEYFITYKDHEQPHSFQDKTHYGIKDRKQAMREQLTGVPHLVCKLFTRAVIGKQRFLPGLARGEDGEFCRAMLHNAERVYYFDRPLYHYVQSEQSAVRGTFRPNQLSFLDTYDSKEQFYSAYYPELLPIVYQNYCTTAIMLYFDMYAEKKSYENEQQRTYNAFLRAYAHLPVKHLSRRNRIKFLLFRLSPKMFAAYHMKRIGTRS